MKTKDWTWEMVVGQTFILTGMILNPISALYTVSGSLLLRQGDSSVLTNVDNATRTYLDLIDRISDKITVPILERTLVKKWKKQNEKRDRT